MQTRAKLLLPGVVGMVGSTMPMVLGATILSSPCLQETGTCAYARGVTGFFFEVTAVILVVMSLALLVDKGHRRRLGSLLVLFYAIVSIASVPFLATVGIAWFLAGIVTLFLGVVGGWLGLVWSDMPGDQIRSFVSIDFDDTEILSKVESIIASLKSLGADLRPVERNNIHLTLKFLGNVTSAKLSDVRKALSGLRFQPFQLEVKGAGAFPSLNRINIIWVGIGEGWPQVQQIFEQTETLLHGQGFSRETRPFGPHITIARVRSSRKKDETAAFLGHLSDESFGTFNAEHVRLKQSVLSPSGPAYSTLFEVNGQK